MPLLSFALSFPKPRASVYRCPRSAFLDFFFFFTFVVEMYNTRTHCSVVQVVGFVCFFLCLILFVFVRDLCLFAFVQFGLVSFHSTWRCLDLGLEYVHLAV